jgi:omega-6 fatty acid desaturase (delta-12 desaturase)
MTHPPLWIKATKAYETPVRSKAIWQIVNTLIPFLATWLLALTSFSRGWPVWLTVTSALASGLLLIRIFIFFHDCTHGSFFASRNANAFWGTIFGILTYTAYADWRISHGMHHAASGNLDKRGVGDIWTMTLDEFKNSTPGGRFWYQIYRNPIMLFLIMPPLLFFIRQRYPNAKAKGRSWTSIIITDIGILAIAAGIVWAFGWQALVFVHLPTFYFVTVVGLWLFYVQHQFDPGYWERTPEWDHHGAAMEGSSHYDLPRFLQWISGNIGFHHVHHLRPRIPNYRLQECYDDIPELQLENPLTLATSLRSINRHIWDEVEKRLLTFRQARRAMQLRWGAAPA